MCCSTNAQGELVSVDSDRFGQGAWIYDTTSGLSGLQPVLSAGYSFNSIQPELLAGGTYAGLRHATADETHQLFLHAEIPEIGTRTEYDEQYEQYQECREEHPIDPTGPGSAGGAGSGPADDPCELPSFGGASSLNEAPVLALMGIISPTSYQGDKPDLLALTGTPAYDGGIQTATLDWVGGINVYQVQVGGLIWGVNTSSSSFGHWLVQQHALGDTNGDDIVDQTDLNLLLANWGQSATAASLSEGELSGDGRVGLDDLSILLRNWGGQETPNFAVPEPSTSVMMLGLVGLVYRRRRPFA